MIILVHFVHIWNYRFSESICGVDNVTKLSKACHNNTAVHAFPINFQLFLTEIGRLLSVYVATQVKPQQFDVSRSTLLIQWRIYAMIYLSGTN